MLLDLASGTVGAQACPVLSVRGVTNGVPRALLSSLALPLAPGLAALTVAFGSFGSRVTKPFSVGALLFRLPLSVSV